MSEVGRERGEEERALNVAMPGAASIAAANAIRDQTDLGAGFSHPCS